jgi:RecB family exonuclease
MGRDMDYSPRTGLTLVLGPANSGKMGHVLGGWRERLSQAPVLVAPTGPDARQLSGEMVRRTGGLVGQSPGLTFDGLVRLLLPRSPRYLTDLERALIISRLLRDTRLEALRPAVHLPGMVTVVAMLFQQLGESGKRPEELDSILARWAAEPDAGLLAGEVRRLAAAYARECVHRGSVDRSTAIRQATEAADGWTRPLALYGFTSFTLGQRALVEALSRRVEVLVSFTYDRSRSVNLSTTDEIGWWSARAVEMVEVSPQTRAYASPAVAYLERHFMSDEVRPESPPAFSGSEGVRFLLASGRRAEAELAAQQIAGLIRAGFRPGEIAVVVRSVRKWSSLLGHVFDSCGIPYQMDSRCFLGETGVGHAFLSALRGVALDEARGVLTYLRSPYSGIAPEEASDLEQRYRRGTAKGARVLAETAENMGLGSVKRLWAMVGTDTTGPDAGPRFDQTAAGDLVRHMLTAGLQHAVAGSRAVEEDARAFRAIQAALACVAVLASDPDGGWLDPQLVLRALAQVSVPGSRTEEGDAVQVLSLQRARARRFEAVAILGLVEGEFPGRPDTPSLLSATQRARLDAIGGGLFTAEPDQEAAFFVSAVSRASRVLLLSARDAEDDGGEATPSRFWESAKQLLGVQSGEHAIRTLADQVFTPQTAPSLRHYLRACAERGLSPHPAVAGTVSCRAVRPWGRPPSRLVAPEVLAEFEAMECFSPSALEGYLSCPFKWFVERVIGAEDADFELDDRIVGQLLHRALAATYSHLALAGLVPLRSEGVSAAERTAFAIVDELVDSDECPGTTAERRLTGWRLKRMVRNLFEMEASAAGPLVPLETEMWVGGSEGVDIGGLRLRGRVDRVDVMPGTGGLFVFDYKTGAIPAPSALGTEEGLQLPLYLLALATERPGAHVVGGGYLSLSAKKRVGVVAAGSETVLGSQTDGYRVLDEGGTEELFRTTREIALGAVAAMRAGVIEPRSDRSCPSWCGLGPACRARRGGYRP